MTYIIDKDIPIPQIRRSKAAKYANTLSEMDVGDSVLFPWNKDKEGNLITGVNNQIASSEGNAFIGYLRKRDANSHRENKKMVGVSGCLRKIFDAKSQR